ncbi:MAG: T9SS type A sorting domain-containing protein, partial [Bacteroidia bacterium]
FGEPVTQHGIYINWEFLTEGEKWPLLKAATILDDITGGSQDTVVRFETLVTQPVSDNTEIQKLDYNAYYGNNSIYMNGIVKPTFIQVFDIKGRVVYSGIADNNITIDLSSEEDGFYIVNAIEIKTNKHFTQKLYKH